MTRPRLELTPEQRTEVLRLAAQGRGREYIRRRMRDVPKRALERLLAGRKGARRPSHQLAWTERQDAYLRDHAGEQGVRRLAREVSRLGPTRTRDAVYAQLGVLGLRGLEPDHDGVMRKTLGDLRGDLTIRQVMQLTGRERMTVMGWIERKALSARMEDGAHRIWPSALRSMVIADPQSVRQGMVEAWGEFVRLVAGEWGVNEGETERRARRRRAA